MVQSNGTTNVELQETLDELQTFPLQVAEFSPNGASSSRGAAAGRLGQVAERTIRDILGWRPKTKDSSGFTSALDQAFAVRHEGGSRTWMWRKRGLSMRGDLGGVTGAQASIYARAKSGLTEAIALLEGLTPLRADADLEDVESIRSIVHDQLEQLVDELGVEGGPVVQRVDQLLELLIEYNPSGIVPPSFLPAETIGGKLGELRNRLGLVRERVNTIDEEHNLSNMITLTDQVSSLMLTWHAQRGSFDRSNSDVFLGTQLVQLDRALEVIVESVHEAELAMDLTFIGADERQAFQLPLSPPITVSELFSWVERVASEEGPRTIKDSGKDGVVHDFRPKIGKLSELVHKVALLSASKASGLPAGFNSGRVRVALQQLDAHLDNAVKLSSVITRTAPPAAPVVSAALPSFGLQNTQLVVTVGGENFVPGARVALKRAGELDILGQPVIAQSATAMSVGFDLTNALVGAWYVVVENPNKLSGTWDQFFTVTRPPAPAPAPSIKRVTPAEAYRERGRIDLQIDGSDFMVDARVTFDRYGQTRLEARDVKPTEDGKRLTCTLDPTGAELGEWLVHVINPDGQRGEWADYFVICRLSDASARGTGHPKLTKVEPDTVVLGAERVRMEIVGDGMRSDSPSFSVTLRSTARRRGKGIEGKIEERFDGGQRISVSFDPAELSAGDWELRVTNSGQGAATWPTPIVVSEPADAAKA